MYHNNCLDGIAAAWVIWRMFPDTTFIPMNYGNDPKQILDEKIKDWENHHLRLFVVDFSFPRDTMIWLSRHTELSVIDHHKTAQEDCEGLPYCTFNLEESGATLTWMTIFGVDNVPTILNYVRDGDLREFNLPGAHEIRAYLHSFPYSIEQMEKFYHIFEGNMDVPVLEGGAILRYRQTLTEIMTKNICIASIGGFDVPVVNASVLASEVTNKLCKDWPQYPFSASYVDNTKEARRLWRLSSIGEFDVSVIAKIYGGGGHRNAAGFTQQLDTAPVETNN